MILKLGIDSTSGVRCTISSEAGLAIQESEPAAPLTSTLIDTGLEGIGGRTLGGSTVKKWAVLKRTVHFYRFEQRSSLNADSSRTSGTRTARPLAENEKGT